MANILQQLLTLLNPFARAKKVTEGYQTYVDQMKAVTGARSPEEQQALVEKLAAEYLAANQKNDQKS